MAIAEVSIVPIGTESTSVSTYVADAINQRNNEPPLKTTYRIILSNLQAIAFFVIVQRSKTMDLICRQNVIAIK